MKKLLIFVGIILGIILGGVFLYKMLFLSTLSNKKITNNKKIYKKLEQNQSKYKYVNPNSKDDFNRSPITVKSVFTKKQKQEIENNAKPKSSTLKNTEITEEKKELILLKNKIKKSYYFSLLSWKFSGEMKNVLLVSYKMYNLTSKPYYGIVYLKCRTLDKDKKTIGLITDNMFVSINSLSTKVLKDIVGIIEPYNVVNVKCFLSINKSNINAKEINLTNKSNKQLQTQLKKTQQKKDNTNYAAPLNLFN